MSLLTTITRRCLIRNSFIIPGTSKIWFSAESTSQSPEQKNVDKLVKANKVVLFMKGDPEQPRCGFSNAVVQIMRMHGVKYDSYDVLQDEKLRQGKSSIINYTF